VDGEKRLEQKPRDIDLPVDVIRALAIVMVIMLHAAIEPTPSLQEPTQDAVVHFWAMNIYNSLSRVSVPLFVMLSGALLLQPSKNESLRMFFKKRFLRIGPAFVFWGAAYFAWRFFVNHEALSIDSIVRGIFTGPYFHFWFLYMIIGLYLITPILRLVVDHAERRLLTYFILLWFFAIAINPIIGIATGYRIDNNVFVIGGWVGYFLLGVYLQKERMRPVFLYGLLFVGLAWTIIGTWIISFTIGGNASYFFYDFLTANVILTSAALFQLLLGVSPDFFKNRIPRFGWLVSLISQYTLPVYLFHVMVVESLEKGYFGFKLSVTTLNPFIEIPLITAVTLFICVGVIFVLKKIPYVKKVVC
jgi:surface polysaccharide O-acyltransferase-like enzyme